jgi:CO dehydrogenase nickel-insertion accessory protein CooC1
MIPNTILVMNGKGGVGKTSLVANLGGLAAFAGWRTLLVDTDPQGNLGRDLGVMVPTSPTQSLDAPHSRRWSGFATTLTSLPVDRCSTACPPRSKR